ncbi:hypothetical protein HYH02_007137 [Chlamydomonas schloesseri]|uniref:DUF3253 domain-containing protein n=1 Tax=Chlamydomonas schloesseri TaxID=2026947 RepID=A0A835WHW0_9CHLO|nr:hypothetical protein HYH02_007137 [Chlamydomonas schloesseri]|eukprot:KAG2447677.1 hypothetical protein HYH02_007137 [Chlamydomonas schloesseri]
MRPSDWRPLMCMTREVAVALARQGVLEVLQKGQPVDPDSFKGPIRLRLTAAGPGPGAGARARAGAGAAPAAAVAAGVPAPAPAAGGAQRHPAAAGEGGSR